MKMHMQELHLCPGMHAENKKNNLIVHSAAHFSAS
jgi:hypothetical protein